MRQPDSAIACLVLLAAVAAACAALAKDGRATTIALAICQTFSVIWLAALSWSRRRAWATVGVLVAAAWTATFLVSSWIYVISPGLLDVGSATHALAVVELSLVCLIGGMALYPRRSSTAAPSYVQVIPTALKPRIVAAWCVAGLLGLAVVLESGGGPLHYLKNLSNEGSLERGKTYFVVLALGLLFAAQATACARWSCGRRLGSTQVFAVLIALGLVALLGARLFIAAALVELGLCYALVRRRPRLRVLVPALVVGAALLIFGLGAVKRYSNYQGTHPGVHISFAHYLRTVAVSEMPTAYANNYADGVRLIALGLIVVPSYAPPEYGKELIRLALQAIPHSWRPNVATAPAIKAAFYPAGGYAYAQPLQLVSYLQLSFPGVVLAFFLLGAVIAELDRRLARPRTLRLSTLLALLALAVDVPEFLRAASGTADSVYAISLLLFWLVVRSSERTTIAA